MRKKGVNRNEYKTLWILGVHLSFFSRRFIKVNESAKFRKKLHMYVIYIYLWKLIQQMQKK